MKVLITGVNGFIGRNVASVLSKKHYVIGTDISTTTQTEVNEYFSWNIGDERIPYEKIPKDLDAIIHIAACLDMDGTNEQLITSNCLGTQRIYQLAKENKIKKIIYLSSVPIIGEPKQIPITEEHLVDPRTVYHVTKLAGELILNQLIYDQIDVINLRLPSPIGVGMNMRTILSVFIRKALDGENIQILGKGTRRQNYIDVRDIANIIKCFAEKEGVVGTFNCGANKTISNFELANYCINITNSKSEIEFLNKEDFADNQNWEIDTTKLKEAIGYENMYSIEDSIKSIADVLKNK